MQGISYHVSQSSMGSLLRTVNLGVKIGDENRTENPQRIWLPCFCRLKTNSS